MCLVDNTLLLFTHTERVVTDEVLKMKITCCCKFQWVANFCGWNSCSSGYMEFVFPCVVCTLTHKGLL